MARKKQKTKIPSESDIAIQLIGVTKTYQVRHEKPTFFEQLVRKNSHETFTALDDINLAIGKGEKVGIIGPNGSGKTTLLKIVAGIATPNSGQVITQGKIVSLIDLAAGFHPDLTGEENIFLNGMVIGMKRAEIEQKFDQIVEFADIGSFIDAPLYTYSDGMRLRLGFSVAVHADPDILILDEGFGVGDEDFRRKSAAKIDEFFEQQKTILLVTHWLGFLRKHFSQRVLRFDKGQLVQDGDISVVEQYAQT